MYTSICKYLLPAFISMSGLVFSFSVKNDAHEKSPLEEIEKIEKRLYSIEKNCENTKKELSDKLTCSSMIGCGSVVMPILTTLFLTVVVCNNSHYDMVNKNNNLLLSYQKTLSDIHQALRLLEKRVDNITLSPPKKEDIAKKNLRDMLKTATYQNILLTSFVQKKMEKDIFKINKRTQKQEVYGKKTKTKLNKKSKN